MANYKDSKSKHDVPNVHMGPAESVKYGRLSDAELEAKVKDLVRKAEQHQLRMVRDQLEKEREQTFGGPLDDIAKLLRRVSDLDDQLNRLSKDFTPRGEVTALLEGRLEAVANPLRNKLSTVVDDLGKHRNFVLASVTKMADTIDNFHKVQDALLRDFTTLRDLLKALEEANKPGPPPSPEVKPEPVPAEKSSAWVAWVTLLLLVLVGVGYAFWQRPGL